MMLSSLLSTHKQTMGHHRVRSEPSRSPDGTGPEIDLRPPVNFVDAMHTLQWQQQQQQQQQHAHYPPPTHPAILGRTFSSQPDPRYQGSPEASTSSLHANVLTRSSALNDAVGETHGSPIRPHQALKKSTSSNSVGHAKKEFICQGFGDCRMAFSRQEHLARHVRKHTGEKPFQCHCGKAFSRLDNLRQHANTTHPQLADQNAAMLQNNTTIRKNMTPPKRAKKGSRRSPSLLDQPPLGFSPQSSSSSDAGNNHSLTASQNECATTACTPNHAPYENYYPSTNSSLYSLPPSDYPTSYSHQMLFPKEEWTPSPTHPTFNDKPIHLPAIDASMWSSQSQPQPQPSGSGSWAQAHYPQLHQAHTLGSMSAPTSPVLHPPFRRGHFKTESSQF